MKYDLGEAVTNRPDRWESFLFIASANYAQRPEMHFAYIKEYVLAPNIKASFYYY